VAPRRSRPVPPPALACSPCEAPSLSAPSSAPSCSCRAPRARTAPRLLRPRARREPSSRGSNVRRASSPDRRLKSGSWAPCRRSLRWAGARQDLASLSRTMRGGKRWVLVRLAKRPNGSRGWLPAEAVTLRRTVNRIEVDLSERRLTLFRRGRSALRTSVAIGKPGTPTPIGEFAIPELIRTNRPGAFLGPVIIPITAFSRTLNEFQGGNGRVAIHGTSGPSLDRFRGEPRLRPNEKRRRARHRENRPAG
jgi:hypothetical protein